MDYILEVKNVTKSYPNFKLDDFSFNVELGKIVGFIGRNGAGKTTTLKGIMNLLHFDSGKVFFMGHDILENETESKQNIGFALSELNYYPNKKIKDLVKVIKRFYPSFDQERWDKLVELFKLDENKPLEQLSSGMKVKYSLAIALSHDAKLFILDEPTSGLDPISRDEILDIFNSLVKTKERSIIFSTHITSDLDKCADDILYIKQGKKIYDGSKEEFLNKYMIVSGKITDYNQSLNLISLAHKEIKDSFEDLIYKDDLYRLDKTNLDVNNPNLDEIMVYLERGNEHEEFVL